MTVRSKVEPGPIVIDYYGNKFPVGTSVAFNFQGELRIGVIEAIKKNEWKVRSDCTNIVDKWWILKFELKIRQPDGMLSTVRNPKSFIVI